MRKLGILFFVVVCTSLAFADQTTRLVKIKIPHHDHVYRLARMDITIIDAGKDFAKALVNDEEITALKAAGYQIEILIEDYQAYKDEIFSRGFYRTYDEVYLALDSFVTNYSNICRLDTIGFSVQGRALWAMRVTDNPGIEENEAEIRLPGNMHGDEHIGTEVPLYFLRHLLTNYATDPQVQFLVNNREIWVLPTINPDGKVANTRTNANGIDLNRDYGYFWDGWGGSPGPSSQIENKIMMQHLEENNVSLEYNYHSVAQYVNYPWDYHQADPPDSQHIINVSQVYADSANLTAINGYDWYQVTGSLQDYTIGTSGALAWTIETLEPAGSNEIDQICYENRDALMDVCERAGWGIEGVVKDSSTNASLYARIEFMNPDRIDVYTDPTLGDFHKMIGQGTYDVRVSVNGYVPKTINGVVVPASGSISLGDILLVTDSSYLYAFKSVLCRYSNHAEESNKTRPRSTLGHQDNMFFSLGQDGYIVLDMGSNTPIRNSPGADFTVYEGEDGIPEGYEIFASDDWEGPWNSCGAATGTSSFDLSVAGLAQARYIRVVDDGSSSSGQYAGFDLDAIQGTPPANAPNLYVSDHQVLDGNNGILEPGETADLVITLHNAGIQEATNTLGKLTTNDTYVTISDSLGFYGNILPDSERTNMSDPFTVSASSLTPYGYVVDFDLIVTADSYVDTTDFTLTVGQLVPSDTGYYYSYWSGGPHTQCPVFEWFPIDTTQTANPGVSLNINSDDQTVQVTLPFTFCYYGVNYTQISVCSNGWISMGSTTITDWSNSGIPNADGPPAMVAGVWDDLYPGYSGHPADIYSYDDAANHRFVVEFFRVPHLGASTTNETFEFLLFDPVYYPTPTGDGEIIVQYLVTMQQTDNTLGIENYAETVGIQYYLDGAYHVNAAPVTDSFAIKYTTWPPGTGIEEQGKISSLPPRTMLSALYPNPFNQRMKISYQVSELSRVGLKVYDASGRLVRSLAEGTHKPGYYTVLWDSKDDIGRAVSAGVYFVRFETDDYNKVEKAVLLK